MFLHGILKGMLCLALAQWTKNSPLPEAFQIPQVQMTSILTGTRGQGTSSNMVVVPFPACWLSEHGLGRQQSSTNPGPPRTHQVGANKSIWLYNLTGFLVHLALGYSSTGLGSNSPRWRAFSEQLWTEAALSSQPGALEGRWVTEGTAQKR